MTFSAFAEVVFDNGLEKKLDYGIPEELLSEAVKGAQVEVSVRGHKRIGYIYSVKSNSPISCPSPLLKIISEQALIPEDLFELALWMSEYYATPLSHVLKVLLPSPVRSHMSHKSQYFVSLLKPKQLIRSWCEKMRSSSNPQVDVLDALLQQKEGMLLSELLEKAKVSRSPIDTLAKKGLVRVEEILLDRSPLKGEQYFKTKPKTLNEEQQQALDSITSSLEREIFEVHLIHGITGSGKTEIYLQAIEKAFSMGKGAILLIPEISLTPQTIQKFKSRFEEEAAILHYRLSKGERLDSWHNIRKGKAKIVIGARSAIFSPVVNLGLIIIDEEHDSAYKQSEEAPCYHARDVAVIRGKMTHSTVVLGSATPSLESIHNAQKKKYRLHLLSQRTAQAQLPKITIVDMKAERSSSDSHLFSPLLLEGIKTRYERGEQSILFLNRRGYHTLQMCTSCGAIFKCPGCELPLAFHLSEHSLCCHLCGYSTPPLKSCPQCKSEHTIKYRGVGTEQVQKVLKALLPEVRTLRIDKDTTRHKGSHEKLFRDFGTGKSDVLIGTQMIAKGLHFPQVTLVAILNTDGALHIPDFRASESVFQLIVQVAGRAGRGELPGEVILQTRMQDNPTIQFAATSNCTAFYESESTTRQLFGFPPFSRLVKFSFTGEEEEETRRAGLQFRAKLAALLPASFYLHPLIASGHPKINHAYRFQFLVRGAGVTPVCKAAISLRETQKKVRLLIDVDPLSTFF